MKDWNWELYPDADKFLKEAVDGFRRGCSACDQLAGRMESSTSSRFYDWVDHMTLPADKVDPQSLMKMGFSEKEACTDEDARVFRHDSSNLFPVLVTDGPVTELAVRVENLSDFQKMTGARGEVNGEFNAPYRKLKLSGSGGSALSVVERRGSAGFAVVRAKDLDPYDGALRIFLSRRRDFAQESKGMDDLERQVVSDLDWLDKARVADAFVRAESAYWERRSQAAQVQKVRQSVLGLGWGNSDHCAFRSSRQFLGRLIRILGMMGFVPRERISAGPSVDWETQILEQPDCNSVVSVEFDVGPSDDGEDLTKAELSEMAAPGPIGRWTDLNGESALQGGIHHLALRLDFERARRDLRMKGVEFLRPSMELPFLRQSFTKGEMWAVEPIRLSGLEAKGRLTRQDATLHHVHGAIGSHLEVIQRDQGFKGFHPPGGTMVPDQRH